MPELVAITPLGERTPQIDSHGPVTITEIVDTAFASVASRRGREAACEKALATLLGAQAPEPGYAALSEMGAFWLAPDQWMVMSDGAETRDLAGEVKAALGDAASVTEQTDAWCRFDLTGTDKDGHDLIAMLERLCALDIRGWTGGEATRTLIEHLGCFVMCIAKTHFVVIGPRSSAGSLHHALLATLKSVH